MTAVPAWNLHRAILPFHFGVTGLGSAASLLELVARHRHGLATLGYATATAETFVLIVLELRRHGAATRPDTENGPTDVRTDGGTG